MATRLAIGVFALDCKILTAAYSDFVGINIRAANFGRLYEAATRPVFRDFLKKLIRGKRPLLHQARRLQSEVTAAARRRDAPARPCTPRAGRSAAWCSGTARAPTVLRPCLQIRRAYCLVTRRARCALQPSWSVDEVRGVARLSTAHRLHK